MNVLFDKKHQKTSANFFCERCYFSCFKLGDWIRHLTNSNDLVREKTSKNIHKCNICNKEYNSRNGLLYHKKKCKIDNIKYKLFIIKNIR
jgi:hypothetical protein